MKARMRRSFDPEVFVNTVNGGRTLTTYKKNQTNFSQGDPADVVFYIHEGKVTINKMVDRGALMPQRRHPSFTYIPTDIAPIACQYCGANAQVIQRSRLAADVEGEMRTFECKDCSKQTKMIVQD